MSATPQLVADRYRLIEPLGQGGMGRVWKARDEVLHRDVAIKELVPPPGLTPEERQEMRERSLREARAIARLNNVNVVRIFDVLRTDGDPWIVMEYVASRSLQDVLASDGPVTPVRAAEIGLGVLGALGAAHRSGVVHRDVKPGNVLLADDGRVVLTDFGLATVPGDPNVTRTGLVLGSPAYIAPERARDGTAGPEADLWSLGATLFAAVEGQSPYARPSAIGTLAALATEPPPPPRRAGPLKPVLNGLLRKDPRARITADEAEKLLRRATGRRPRAGRPLLDGVRRPSVFGPRESEPATKVVPAPRQSAEMAIPVIPGKTAKIAMPSTAPTPEPPAAETTVVEPAEVVETTSKQPAVPSEPAPVNRLPWLAAVAALLVVVLAVVLISVLNDDEQVSGGPAAGTSAPTTPAAAPTTAAPAPTTAAPTTPAPSATAAPSGLTLPAGWHIYTDRTGFSVAVPESWTVSRSRTMVYFREQGGEYRILGIDQTDQPKSDPVADWTRQEQQRRNDYRSYQRVKIAAVDYFDKAADWEWVYTSLAGNRIHVVNRGFVTAPDKAYAIYWSTPDASWAANQDEFALIASSFRPVRD
ncbi:serine/threonine-protein kinase [Micromonospora sp. CPCC 206061]|uniref:serine/threonine-protein kinase n=1 Tax=Micromonospora sp. CPCC 206061 TaxID=3122410 RepID=UPI002FF0E73B